MTGGKKRQLLKAEQVRYLVFEGGGGKGAAYEGVFEALTAHKLLQKRGPGGNRLLGVAGASAGALTAMYVALGFTLEDLREELKFDFTTFLDGVDPGKMRGIKRREIAPKLGAIAAAGKAPTGIGPVQAYVAQWGPAPPGGQRWDVPFDKVDAAQLQARAAKSLALAEGWTVKLAQAAVIMAWAVSQSIGVKVINKVRNFPMELINDLLKLNYMLTTGKPAPQAPVRDAETAMEELFPTDATDFSNAILSLGDDQWKKIVKPYLKKIFGAGPADFGRSIHALSYDRGLFTGIEMRDYCARTLKKWLKLDSMETARNLSFSDFYALTQCDLCVSGTNITLRRSGYFSKRHTPHFPVAEAIALSMSIPFVFKPVLINYVGAPDTRHEKRYAGLWVDGGLLNNLPIHAFDDVVNSDKPGYARPLNKEVLAFRLSPDERPDKGPEIRMPAGGADADPLFCEFAAHRADVLTSVLSPAEEGQLRTMEEVDQTVEIYCGTLSTLDFSNDAQRKKYGNDDAKNATNAYFLGKKLAPHDSLED